ncbi:hypothetical protein ABB07_01085 [Streptomyces incarnatus]|uniref:Uncharacterized protein n=1 Tax=Streptomyces incarnatus TaxID=665007 RepID=A0ABN4G544_9ACTN|nr:hypothetical protein [Streptomyces incarnatus]AKJ08681.1 hypothetical protein ABB07_01085 [Streptomyces incarnatus]
MTDDPAIWNRLAALLPEAEAREVMDCWAVGEQEAGLGLLVSGILEHQVLISDSVRAQISVLAEAWGEREALTPQILQCRDGGTPGPVRLIEGDGSTAPEAMDGAEQDLAGLVLVPWIACARCGQVLMRAHARESWGGLSYLARHYVITTPNRATVLRLFPADAADAAFAALQQACSEAA